MMRSIVQLQDMFLYGQDLQETLIARGTVIFFLQKLGLIINLKEFILALTQKIVGIIDQHVDFSAERETLRK